MHQYHKAMKTIAKMIAMIFLLGATTCLMPKQAQAYYGWISFQVFYDELSPYGAWVDSPDYGYVWVPDAGPGFFPYSTGGYWVYTSFGWTWISEYPWGWAPFHYGRWYYDKWYGWVWVPGTEWGPGWVSWRRCNGYYGWAPLAPGFSFAMPSPWNYRIPYHHWVFVPDLYFGRHDLYRHYVNRADNEYLLRNSSFVGNTYSDRQNGSRYYTGPEIAEVNKRTGRDIRPVEIRDNGRPGQSVSEREVKLYRPGVRESGNNKETRPAPNKYDRYGDTKKNPEVRSGRPVTGSGGKEYSSPRKDPAPARPDKNTPGNNFSEQPVRQNHPSAARPDRPAYGSREKDRPAAPQQIARDSQSRQARPVEKKNPAPEGKMNRNDGSVKQPVKKNAAESSRRGNR